jgi:hypothetical protein
MIAVASPFRSDGRVDRRVSCAPGDVAMRVMARSAVLGLPFAGYLAALALGAAVFVYLLPGQGASGAPAVIVPLLIAAAIARSVLRGGVQSPRQLAALPTSCAFTADAMILEGAFGESAWRYEGIRALTLRGPWLVVVLEGDKALVLRADEPAAEALDAFIARRAPRLEARDRRITLALLALTYLALGLGGVVLARTYGG